MAPSRTSGAGNALGLTSTKSRAASVRASGKRAAKLSAAAQAVEAVHVAEHAAESAQPKYTREQLKKAEGLPSIHIDDPRFDGIWQRTRKTMGMQPIHSEGLSRIEHILRVFDLDPAFGPCMGLTRLERWERAKDIGNDPPNEVREILLSREGMLDWSSSILDQDAGLT